MLSKVCDFNKYTLKVLGAMKSPGDDDVLVPINDDADMENGHSNNEDEDEDLELVKTNGRWHDDDDDNSADDVNMSDSN